jgi:hypothetical protein
LIGTSVAAAATPGCALIFDGAKAPENRDYERILWGYLILDILLTGLIGLIIDFATGAIYARSGGGMTRRARPLRLCDDAMASVAGFERTRQVAQYLKGHVHGCAECSHSLRHVDAAPEEDVGELIAQRGDVLHEAVQVELAKG